MVYFGLVLGLKFNLIYCLIKGLELGFNYVY